MAINARFQMKRDTLANWNASSIVLKPGELAVAYVDVATTDPKGNIIHVPTALLKTGENVENSTKTFKDLPFISALAADVYPWAKKDGIEVVDTETGNVVSDVEWDKTNNRLVIHRTTAVTPTEQANALKEYYNSIEGSGAIVVDPEQGEKGMKATVSLKINTTNGNVRLVQGADGLTGNVDLSGYQPAGDYKTVQTAVVDPTASGNATAFIDSISQNENGEVTVTKKNVPFAGTEAGLIKSGNIATISEGVITAVSFAATAGSAGSAGSATNDANGKAIHDHYETKDNVALKISEAKKYTDDEIAELALGTMSKETAADYLTKAQIEAGYAAKATSLAGYGITDAYTQTQVNNLIQEAKTYADTNDADTQYHIEYDSTAKKIKLVAGANASKMEIPTDDFIKDGMISSVEIKDNNLVITWNADAGKTETKIPLTELVDVMTGVDGTTITVSVSADDKISAEVKAGSITTSHIAANAGIVKTQLHADVQTSLGLADSAVQPGDIGTMAKEAAADYIKKDDIDDFAVTTVVTGSANGTIAVDGTNVAVKGLGSAAYTEASAYATSAQGGKADSALQVADIATGTMNGTISVKGGNIQVKGLGSAAFTESSIYATVTQGATADANKQVLDSLGIVNGVVAQATWAENATYFGSKTADKYLLKSEAEDEYATLEGLAGVASTASTAVQTVVCAENSGLKATRTQNSVTIDWDTSKTLVFDCGTATTVI